MKIIAARLYVSIRSRALTPDERETRAIAYRLKMSDPEAVLVAAREMAPYVPAGATLIPVPDSQGGLTANLALCRAIAQFSGAKVKKSLARAARIQPSCERHRLKLPPYTWRDHKLYRVQGFLPTVQTFFVDNVVTSGATLEACRRVLGFGDGLVFADANRK